MIKSENEDWVPVDFETLKSMSDKQIRDYFQSLSPEERRAFFAAYGEQWFRSLNSVVKRRGTLWWVAAGLAIGTFVVYSINIYERHQYLEIRRQLEEINTVDFALRMDDVEQRTTKAIDTIENLEARVGVLLEASEEENVRTVMVALQRFNDFSGRVERVEKDIDSLGNRIWLFLLALGAGVFGLFFKDEIKSRFSRKDKSPPASPVHHA